MSPRKTGRTLAFRGMNTIDKVTHTTRKMPGQVRDWQIKCVCGGDGNTCNNGWMRRIEDNARHAMPPLIQGQSIRVSPEAQIAIATWAVLKTMIAEREKDSYVTSHHMHRSYFMRHKRPPSKGWGVWIGSYERGNWLAEWISTPLLLLPDKVMAKRSSRQATYYNTKATTQVTGKLLIHVIHSPMPGLVPRWRFALPDGGTLFRIWPPASVSIKWPAKFLTDRDADLVANALAAFVFDSAVRGRTHASAPSK